MRIKPLALAVDDDAFFRKALEVTLPRLGLDVKVVPDAAKFLDFASKNRPEIYVIDLKLVGSTGFELIEEVRALDSDAVIVVISGTEEKADIAHALEQGATDFLLKPLDMTLLASKFARYLNTERLAERQSQFVEIPAEKAPARLTVSMTISSIDELGVGLESNHLIPKGTVLKLKSEFFRNAGIPYDEVLITVVKTSFDSDREIYSIYAEFDHASTEFTEPLCRWLQQKESTKSQSIK